VADAGGAVAPATGDADWADGLVPAAEQATANSERTASTDARLGDANTTSPYTRRGFEGSRTPLEPPTGPPHPVTTKTTVATIGLALSSIGSYSKTSRTSTGPSSVKVEVPMSRTRLHLLSPSVTPDLVAVTVHGASRGA